MAYEQRRVFLIRWTKPATLETYLVPPVGGCDWRVPEWLAEKLANDTNGKKFVASKVMRQYGPTNLTLMRVRYQSNIAGQDYYNLRRYSEDEPTFMEVFASIWRIFFRPSHDVANIIDQHMASNGLVPGRYVASHLRALYAIEYRPPRITRRWTLNAVNCASKLRPGAPIFFTSDSKDATEIALEYGKQRNGNVILHPPHPNPPLHLDGDWTNHTPADYYDTFVDLYLIALAGCVAFNKGGYGHWGLLIGGNITCRISHAGNAKGVFDNECAWHGGPAISASTPVRKSEPLFLDPMP